ncbi:MAG: aldo/keto reductase [Fidelibacterota bacterium]
MPILGLGTYRLSPGRPVANAVRWAIEAGYRLIDTASMYGNERDVGEAIRRSGVPRDQVFVTTKLWNSDHGYESTLTAFDRSLNRLGLTYVDLYLIHWPVEGIRRETWRAMEAVLEGGKCRAVGVSNYMTWHLDELMKDSSTIPAVNQVEFSPYLYQKDLLEYCRSHGIQLEAYSPLTKARRLSDPRLLKIGSRYNKTPAQVLIRWALQKGTVVIPKSSRRERIAENAHVFDFSLSGEDMAVLDSFHEDYRTTWDPTTVL